MLTALGKPPGIQGRAAPAPLHASRRPLGAALQPVALACSLPGGSSRVGAASLAGRPLPALRLPARTAPQRQLQVRARAEPATDLAPGPDEPAKRNLLAAANATRHWGWISFWAQLVLSVVSAVILVFSVAFTAANGPSVSLYLTLFGVVAAFFSTFWAFGYTRLARRLRATVHVGPADLTKRVKKADVLATLERGAWVNLLGMASTLLGLQATVGLLVAKTLTNATANPFLSGGVGSYNPVLALDVFLVQASTNTLLAHFVALAVNLWLVKVVGGNANRPPGKAMPAPA